ncbi:MAG: H(+)/Cl(-) exchange transporter ClcA [Pirellulales bacterium]
MPDDSQLPPAPVFARRFRIAEGARPMWLFFWAAATGCLAGLIAAAFQTCVSLLTTWRENLADHFPAGGVLWWLVPVSFSAVSVALAVGLVRWLAPEAGGSGVQEIEGALDGLRPLRWQRVLPVKFFGGLLSLGSGLVLGREGPTIQMGGNVGRMLADLFRLGPDDGHTLVAAGAGAGLSAAFNAPLAGILFVIEEMRPQFKYSFLSVHSVLIATATADIVVRVLLGQDADIRMVQLPAPPLASLWLFALLGVPFGVFGVVFNHLLLFMLDFFGKLSGGSHRASGLLLGAVVGALALVAPDAVGGGYHLIPRALEDSLPAATLLLLFVARFGTTAFSYGSGAPGGIFTPMLALATLFGMWSGHFAHEWFPAWVVHPQVFAVAGMGALFSATVRAPLTGVALSIEMTDNYTMILPLILTCMVAAIVAQALGGRPIYSLLLARTLKQDSGAPARTSR